jgi:RimJ/RimL family protein N-acetyltransferase
MGLRTSARRRARRLHRVAETTIVAASDADFAAMLRGDAQLASGLRVAPGGVESPAILEMLRGVAARLRGRAFPFWMMVADGEVVGLCSYKAIPSNGQVEIGYGVAPNRRRRGHATRAIRALLADAARDPAIQSITAQTNDDNAASIRVLESNGFRRVGVRTDPAEGRLILWESAVDGR